MADTTIHYWRIKDKAEVDFIIRRGDKVIPIKVKYRDMKKMKIRRSFCGFLARYRPEIGYVVNQSLYHEEAVGDTKVICTPYWELMFADLFPERN